ncbi:MAG: type II toxin-antitoxin system RelE/ParE family toxin [Fimbriimonadaceae bacterium]|nr:type II toxin-antitoxin system RelE/ParE family toxin [Fimbriimonadaceae bacterium]
MFSYRISGPADKEIDDILTHIAEDAGVEAGLGIVSDFLDLFYLLAQQPRAGRLVPEFGREIRRFPCGAYLIYYRVQKTCIEVLHVFHGRRDQKKAWRKRP